MADLRWRSLLVTALAAALLSTACDPTGGKRPPGPGSGPPYETSVRPANREELGASWREGCPVHWRDLSVVRVAHWDFEGRRRVGELVVHDDVAASIGRIFGELYDRRFQIASIRPVVAYGANDDLSMAHNNTSAFNCRFVAGTTRWSRHASGRAVDLNPLQNPWVRGRRVDPPGGRFWLDRSRVVPGMVVEGAPVVAVFEREGWTWGGRWREPDHQHFER